MNHKYHTIILSLFASTSLLMAAGGGGTVPIPDFTKGDPVPAGYTHDWNLGPTGLRGWIYSDTLVTSDARQILITKVQPASPGDGKFANGDVILGVGGKPFSHDPRSEVRNPHFPASGPTQWLFQGSPAESKLLSAMKSLRSMCPKYWGKITPRYGVTTVHRYRTKATR